MACGYVVADATAKLQTAHAAFVAAQSTGLFAVAISDHAATFHDRLSQAETLISVAGIMASTKEAP